MNTSEVHGDILIVDDMPANLRLLAQILTEHGYKVRPVRSGHHALKAAQAAPPDLILLDIVMPDMDGYEVCQHLKADERTRDIPILFISALGETEDKVRAFAAGGVDYVPKPFQPAEVLARVRTHLALRNLTRQLQEANAELARRVQELQERNEELDAFAHTVAHDIKSPLTIIAGYAELLDDGVPESTRKEYLQILRHGANRLVNIVDGLLLLASVRKLEILPEPLDMERIVNDACARLAHVIQEYQAEIVRPPQWPAAVGYAPWVEEVWVNYISNGCKYGGTPPRLELGYSMLGAEAEITFWVRDNGDGISPDDQARLFVPFTRLNQVSVKGHGLGLSIVRRIVEKLGGRVGVESAGVPGEGSLFYFTLPAAPSADNGWVTGSSHRMGMPVP
ncbi:MAG: hybrid sensor histidine kinase/response regulator [Anaerolineae bacterium]|nr:hybrid sensor histidine kinase/response regulator [Anaerolineae bacterium]